MSDPEDEDDSVKVDVFQFPLFEVSPNPSLPTLAAYDLDDDDVMTPEQLRTMEEYWELKRQQHEEMWASNRALNESILTHDFVPPINLAYAPEFTRGMMVGGSTGGAMPEPVLDPPTHICVRCQYTDKELMAMGGDPQPYGPCNAEGALKRKLKRKWEGK